MATNRHIAVTDKTLASIYKIPVSRIYNERSNNVNFQQHRNKKIGGQNMLWKCDICNKVIDLQDANSLTNVEVLTNKGYWRWVYNNTEVTEDTLAVYIQQLYSSSGGYKICDDCNSILNKNKDFSQSTIVDAYTIAKIAGSTWQDKYGKWPNSVRFGAPPSSQMKATTSSVSNKLIQKNIEQVQCDFCNKKVWCKSDAKIALMHNDEGLTDFENKIGIKHVRPSSRKANDGAPLFLACPDCVDLYQKRSKKNDYVDIRNKKWWQFWK